MLCRWKVAAISFQIKILKLNRYDYTFISLSMPYYTKAICGLIEILFHARFGVSLWNVQMATVKSRCQNESDKVEEIKVFSILHLPVCLRLLYSVTATAPVSGKGIHNHFFELCEHWLVKKSLHRYRPLHIPHSSHYQAPSECFSDQYCR